MVTESRLIDRDRGVVSGPVVRACWSIIFFFLPLLLLQSISALPDQAVDSSGTKIEAIDNNPRFSITICDLEIDDMRVFDTLDILLDSGGDSVAAIEINFAMDNQYLHIVEILPGRLCDSCQWEFFSARRMSDQVDPNSSLDLWQIVVMADLMPDSEIPLCYGLDTVLSLARIVLSNENIDQVEDRVVSIDFIWSDCSNNTISSPSGSILYLADTVYAHDGFPIKPKSGQKSGLSGPDSDCFKPGVAGRLIKSVLFHNGSVNFKLNLEP